MDLRLKFDPLHVFSVLEIMHGLDHHFEACKNQTNEKKKKNRNAYVIPFFAFCHINGL